MAKQQFIKYPRSPHLPWSPGATSDDTRLFDTLHFEGKEVVVTEKMDGENTSMYRDGLHARSIDGRHHPSRDWLKAMHAAIQFSIPQGWRLCGENLFARHSISYDQLESYFYLFSVWNDENLCLSWDETVAFAEQLGLSHVPVIYRGPWDEPKIRKLVQELDTSAQEGIVVRVADHFHFDSFKCSLAKWVRKNHVQTQQHWMHAQIIPNKLKDPGQ